MRPNDANELGIGMVHQHFQLVHNFTVTENIILGNEGAFVLRRREASKKIKALSEKYGLNIDPDMQLERETSRMMNLVADLDYKLAPQVQLLGLKPYVDALRAANDTVEELLATRTDDRSQQIAGALRKARLASDEAYLDTVRLINAMAVVGTEKSLTPLINYLNANIKRYKEQVMTRGKKKDDDRPEKYGGDNTTTARTADTLTAADENS